MTAISLDERARSRCGCIVAPSPGVPRGVLSIMRAWLWGGGGGLRRRWGSMVIKHENLELEELCSERTEIIGTSAQPPTCRTENKYLSC